MLEMEQEEKLGYLNGIKAIAMILVFNIHFLNAYYCGIYTLNPEQFHTIHNIEWYIGATPLNIIYAGKLGARIFLVISAFLLARKFFITDNHKNLMGDMLKKYVRLVGPIIVVNILIFLLMWAGCYHNQIAAVLANSVEFFGGYNQFKPNILLALKEAVWGCFIAGDNAYNGPLWFIYYEFWGCALIAAVLSLTGKKKVRYLIYGIAIILFIRSDFLVMILGMVLADVLYTKQELVHWFGRKKWLMYVLLLICFFFGTYPSYGSNLAGSIYEIFPPKVLFYYNVAIPGGLFAITQLELVQKCFTNRLFEKFNRISYCFYLVHFPILCTLSAAFFVAMYDKINYHILVLLNYILTFMAAALVAWVLTKFVDNPGKKLARTIGEQLSKEI